MILTILTKLFEAVNAAGRWAVQRPKDAAIILLSLLLFLMLWRFNRERQNSSELATKIAGLPPNIQQTVTVYRDHIVTKWRDGPTKIEYRDRYLPPEGNIEVVTKTNPPEKPPEIVINDWGLTHRMGGGIVYSGKLLPMLDLKWAYWRRYSATVGITPEFGGLGVSRHMDDLTPFENLELLGVGGLDWRGSPQFGLGVRTNF